MPIIQRKLKDITTTLGDFDGRYQVKDEDIWVSEDGLNSRTIQIKNGRAYQEDRFITDTLTDFEKLTSDEQTLALHNAVARAQKAYGSEESGSTLSFAAASLDAQNRLRIKGLTLGDSRAYVLIKENNKVVYIKRLSDVLHSPAEESEYKRLTETGRKIKGGRIMLPGGGSCGVSRSIGDAKILTHASDHVGDVFTLKNDANEEGIVLKENQKAYLLLASDGLTDDLVWHSKTADDEKNEIVNLCNDVKQPESLSATIIDLISHAVNVNSKDNITVTMMPITKAQTVCAAIFDGHGGDAVADKLQNNFKIMLRLEMLKLLMKEEKEEKSERKIENQVKSPIVKEIVIEPKIAAPIMTAPINKKHSLEIFAITSACISIMSLIIALSVNPFLGLALLGVALLLAGWTAHTYNKQSHVGMSNVTGSHNVMAIALEGAPKNQIRTTLTQTIPNTMKSRAGLFTLPPTKAAALTSELATQKTPSLS